MATYPEKLAAHILFFAVFFVAITNIGLLLGITISIWHLPIIYLVYIGILGIIKWWNKAAITKSDVLLAIAVPVVFFALTYLFSFTFDTTFDGQNYQQTAVISLADGWNPIRDASLNIPAVTGQYGQSGEFGKIYAIGYPKAIWIIQSSIYKLTGNINSAVVTNLIAALVALVFCYFLLRRIGLGIFFSGVLGILAVLQPHFLEQFFSFMEDGVSYQLSLAMIAALVTLLISPNKKLPLMVFAASWLLVVDTKYSNAYLALGAAILCLGILVWLIYKDRGILKQLLPIIGLGLFVGILVLANPYVVNLYRYGNALYPDSYSWAQGDVITDNIPLNLKNTNKLELLFYGIYSQRQVGVASSSAQDNVAQLKIPFTFSNAELEQVDPERVGTAGVLFSGVFSLGVLAWLFASFASSSKRDRLIVAGASVIIIFIIGSALAQLVPNTLRYTPQISLIPIIALIALLLIDAGKQSRWLNFGKSILLILIVANTWLTFGAAIGIRVAQMNDVRQQLASMRNSGLTYQVYSADFYSSYIRLQENGVKFIETTNPSCTKPGILDSTYGAMPTIFCSNTD
jgi:hypothetical protein